MLNPADIAREFLYPASNAAVALSVTFLFLLLRFAAWGGVLGLFLVALVMPALLRYLMRLLDARAKGADPGPLEVDDMLWLQHVWSLFQIVHVGILVLIVYYVGGKFGTAVLLPTIVVFAAVLPASLAVLAITRSPLECLNPFAVGRLIDRAGGPYWILPSYLIATTWLLAWLVQTDLPALAVDFAAFYLNVAFFALTGGVLQPLKLHDEVAIHDPVEPQQENLDDKLLAQRTSVLNHAYGFISRDNRAGGFRHIEGWLREDPDPESAWGWFFEQMLRWEIEQPALLFGQSYVHELLAAGDRRTAVKVIMRCLHVNENFKPLPDDIEAAITAAEDCGNQELAERLRARV